MRVILESGVLVYMIVLGGPRLDFLFCFCYFLSGLTEPGRVRVFSFRLSVGIADAGCFLPLLRYSMYRGWLTRCTESDILPASFLFP
jgi:hypothetical protein